MKKIKKILTAIGNPFLNNELKKYGELIVINNDVQYQDGIFEILELNSEINYLVLSELLPGDLKIDELIKKIINKNSKIKIILILEKNNELLEKNYIENGVYKIFYNNKTEINNILKIINEDEKIEKYNIEIRKEINEIKEYIKNNKKLNNKKIIKNNINKKIKINKLINIMKNNVNKIIKNKIIKNKLIKNNYLINYFLEDKKTEKNKVITVLGNNGSGKSLFSVVIANTLEKYSKKILIIDFDVLNNSLHTILGVKKYSEKIKNILDKNLNINKINIENLIININKKIDLISGINLIFDSNNKISEEKLNYIIKILSEKYDFIIIDTSSECFFEYNKELIKISDKSIFLTEPNLLEISKSKRFLEMYYYNWKIEKNKINIIFNKFNKNSIDINLLKKLFYDYKIIGKIKLKNNYNLLINNNFKNIKIKNNLLKKYNNFGKNFLINN